PRLHPLQPHRRQASRPGRPPGPPLPRCEVELHRLEIGHQEIRGRPRPQCGQRLEMTVAARTRLDGPSLDPPCDDQRSQALVIALAAVDAREPRPLPVGTAAPAPETTGSLEPAQLREHRPCPAARAIATTPR